MQKTKLTSGRFFLGLAAALALTVASPMFGASVDGKAYQVNVISSFGTSFTDCFRFSSGNVFEIDGCADSGPYGEAPALGTTFFTGWAGSVPCGGLNLQWVGSAVFGANFPAGGGADLISATAVGESEGTTFAVNGFAVNTCPRSAAKGGMNYSKGK